MLSVAAFAPSARRATSSALKMAFENELGAQPPLGFWDPLGLLADADQERFDRLRTVETKHGRISMLAILGHLVTTAGARVPLGPNEVKTGLAVFDTLPTSGLAVTFLTIGAIELGFASCKVSISLFPPLLITITMTMIVVLIQPSVSPLYSISFSAG